MLLYHYKFVLRPPLYKIIKELSITIDNHNTTQGIALIVRIYKEMLYGPEDP